MVEFDLRISSLPSAARRALLPDPRDPETPIFAAFLNEELREATGGIFLEANLVAVLRCGVLRCPGAIE